MPKNYDLRREVEVAKMQTLIDSVDAIDTSGLATEAKQDVQIINQGTETVSPPFGTKILGWLQSIWNEISGQTNTLENNEENTFNINEKIIVDTDDDSIAVNQILPTNINLLYGWEEQEGGVWQRIHTDTEGRLKVQQDFQPLPIGAATENTLLGVKGKTDQLTFTGNDLNVNANVTLPPGLATEATLAGIKAQTDLLTFALDRLKVEASVTLDGESSFGDNATKTTIALSDVSTIVLASNADRKQAVIVNSTNKTIWVCYGSPATYGGGIPLFKNDILIEDRYRGIITGIMNTGETGNIQITEVTL